MHKYYFATFQSGQEACACVLVCTHAGIINFPLCSIHWFNSFSSHAQFQKTLMFWNVMKTKSKETILLSAKNSTINSPINRLYVLYKNCVRVNSREIITWKKVAQILISSEELIKCSLNAETGSYTHLVLHRNLKKTLYLTAIYHWQICLFQLWPEQTLKARTRNT